MPQLGLGLGLDKSSQLKSLAQLVKSAGGVLYLDARKADGVKQGVNAPFTNPLIDLTKLGNNATLTNFAGTQTDGYTLEATVNSNGQSVGYSNLVTNGDFANTSTWVATAMSFSVLNNEALLLATAQFATLQPPAEITTAGARYYARGEIKANSNLVSLRIYDGTAYQTKLHSGSGNYELLSVIATIPSNTSAFRKSVILDSRTSGWSTINAKNMQTIRLDTNPFVQALETQLGRQLTVSECDRIFPFVATTGTTLVSARPYIATDGIDSYGVLANNTSVDIVGTGSFAYATGFITPTTLVTGALYFDGNNGSVLAGRKICPILVSDGSLTLTLEGTSITLASPGTIKPNTYCDIRIIRDSGVLKCTINGVETYSVANTTNLVTKTNKRLFAITTNVGGTTHGTYLRMFSSHEVLASGSDVSKLNGVLDKVVKDYR